MNRIWIGLVAAAAMGVASAAGAAEPGPTCESAKLKVSAKYASCRLSGWSKAVRTGVSPDFSRCSLAKFAQAEEQAMGACPTVSDDTTIAARIDADVEDIASLLAGGTVEPNYMATGQTTTHGAGDDGDLQTGAAPDFVDNGDGTITDRITQLMWEKKVNLGSGGDTRCDTETGPCTNPHHLWNAYPWSIAYYDPRGFTGPIRTIFLEQLNNRCDKDTTVSCDTDADCSVSGGRCGFAGHRDWRLPSVRELQTIVDYGRNPTVGGAFFGGDCNYFLPCPDIDLATCSCTLRRAYWSSTTSLSSDYDAWTVQFTDGSTTPETKTGAFAARAVRGGS